jgi:hypothetical protein
MSNYLHWAVWVTTFAGVTQTVPTSDAKEHDGEKVTVCGHDANEHVALTSKGSLLSSIWILPFPRKFSSL